MKAAEVTESITYESLKFFLEEIPVFINGEQDNRRGRKLYPGDIVSIEEFGEFIILIQK